MVFKNLVLWTKVASAFGRAKIQTDLHIVIMITSLVFHFCANKQNNCEIKYEVCQQVGAFAID